MAAIFKLRRGSSASPALTDGELFLNYSVGTIQYASGSSVYSLLPLDKSTSGDILLTGDVTATNLTLSGDASIDGNIVLGGSIFLGDGDSTDEIIINASLSGSLLPDVDAEYDLGSTSYRYKNLHVVSASIEDLKVPGSGILSSSDTNFSDYTSSVENRLTNIESATSSLDSRLDTEETKSTTLETVTSSFDGRLDNLELTSASHDGRLDNIELVSQSHDGRLDNLELTSASHDSRITQLETDTGSQDNRLDNLELTSASHDGRLDNLESATSSLDSRLDVEEAKSTTLQTLTASYEDRFIQLESDSGSQEGRLDNLELTSASHDSRLDNIESATSSLDSRLDTEETKSTTLETVTSSFDDRITQLESNSGSQEGRLDNLELTSASHENRLDLLSNVSHSHSNKANLDTIDQDLGSTDSVTFDTGSFTGNVTVNGNLTVLGSATEISTTELSIEDKLITLASGSADSATADGAGIEIDGANVSLTWDHNTTQFVFDSKVSSSVGFKGDGSELTDIQHGNVDFGGSLILSGSSQVTQSLDLRYLEINGDDVVSGSEQIVFGDISNRDTNIVSQSTDSTTINFSITNGNITGDVIGGVLSGSAQVTQSLDLRYLEIGGDDVISGSSQVTSSLDSRYEDKSSATHTLVSGSDQVTSSLDLRYLEIGGDGVISGSSQLTSSYDSRYEDKSSATHTLISGSDQVTSSLDLRYLEIGGDSVISGSDQVTSSLDDRYESQGSGIISSSTFESNHQGVFTSSINDTDTNVDLGLKESDSPTFNGLTLGTLTSLGSAEVATLIQNSGDGSIGKRSLGTAAFLNVSNSIDNDQNVIPTNFAVNQALIAAGAGDITSVNPSSTYGNGETTGLLHNGDGTDVAGIYGTQGDIVLEIATGSSHFTDGVLGALPSGLVSGSSQLTSSYDLRYLEIGGDGVISGSSQLTSSYDLRYLEINGDDVVSGSEQIIDILDSLNSYTQSNDNDISNLESTTASFDDRLSQLETETGSIATEQATQDGRLDNLESFTSSLDDDYVTQTELASATGSLETKDGEQDTRLDNLETETGSIATEQATQDGRLTAIESVTSSLDTTYLKINGDDVISGSEQVDFTQIINRDTNIVSQSSDSENIDFTITNGVISADLKGGVVSGSTQINTLIVGTSYSESVDTRLDTLEGDTHTHSNKSNLDTINQDLSTTSSITFDSGSFTGNVTVNGNFTVLGSATEISTTELTVQDKLITIASGSADSAAADGAGISIDGANESITWDHSNSRFNVSDDLRVDGTLTATGDVVAYASSDRNLKNNIQPISNPLEKINQISGNSFVWNEEKQNIYKGKDYGVIAQEIEEILPELVKTSDSGYKSVKYDRIVSLLIEGIKELSNEVSELKKRLG